MNRLILALVLAVSAVAALAQPLPLQCTGMSAVPPLIRHEGVAELLSDVLLVCTGGDPAASVLANFRVFLSTGVTSNVTVPTTVETEGLLLIDEPQPSPATNYTNGFAYLGQVKGTPGTLAGFPGSGNYYGGVSASPNSLAWSGVPLVPPGPAGQRILRFTNLRANAHRLDVSGPPVTVTATVYVQSSIPIPIVNPQQAVAFVQNSLSSSLSTNGSSAIISYSNLFASAFRRRIQNVPGSPAPASQNIPGLYYCTESGFTPEQTLDQATPGYANTGTRLAAFLDNIPAGISLLAAPNYLPGPTGIGLRRVLPPFGASFDGGSLAPETGYGVSIVQNHQAVLLYEVTATTPYQNDSGCMSMGTYQIQVRALPSASLAGTTMRAMFAPINSSSGVSQLAPEPRFLP